MNAYKCRSPTRFVKLTVRLGFFEHGGQPSHFNQNAAKARRGRLPLPEWYLPREPDPADSLSSGPRRHKGQRLAGRAAGARRRVRGKLHARTPPARTGVSRRDWLPRVCAAAMTLAQLGMRGQIPLFVWAEPRLADGRPTRVATGGARGGASRGQAVRGKRSDLILEPVGGFGLGRFVVHGRGKKHGEVVDLHPELRRASIEPCRLSTSTESCTGADTLDDLLDEDPSRMR